MPYYPVLCHHQLPVITLLALPKTQFKIPSFTHQFPPRLFVPHFLTKNPSGYPKCSLGSSSLNPPDGPSPEDDDFEVELGRLLALLPEEMRRRVVEHPELHQLIEVVMDLGRKPLARFPSGDFVLSDLPITAEDLEHATSQVKDVSCPPHVLLIDLSFYKSFSVMLLVWIYAVVWFQPVFLFLRVCWLASKNIVDVIVIYSMEMLFFMNAHSWIFISRDTVIRGCSIEIVGRMVVVSFRDDK